MVEYFKSLTVFPNLSPILFCAIFYHKIACFTQLTAHQTWSEDSNQHQ